MLLGDTRYEYLQLIDFPVNLSHVLGLFVNLRQADVHDLRRVAANLQERELVTYEIVRDTQANQSVYDSPHEWRPVTAAPAHC